MGERYCSILHQEQRREGREWRGRESEGREGWKE